MQDEQTNREDAHHSAAFVHRLRVRYQETDQMGVVYHGNYLTWFEIARTEWIRVLGMSYGRLEEKGLLLPVVGAELKYHQPARYDEEVDIEVTLVACSPVRLEFAYGVRRAKDGTLLVTGRSRHAWVKEDWTPARLDRMEPDLYKLLQRQLSTRQANDPRDR